MLLLPPPWPLKIRRNLVSGHVFESVHERILERWIERLSYVCNSPQNRQRRRQRYFRMNNAARRPARRHKAEIAGEAGAEILETFGETCHASLFIIQAEAQAVENLTG